ncbi:hypothetical protein JT359_16185 [Candidatus Poribacteria bacterium]|nr:hypothetical protein [Candidatus Poribacteria bacterium]
MSNFNAIKDQIDEVKENVREKFKNFAVIDAIIDAELINTDTTSEGEQNNKIQDHLVKAINDLKITDNNIKDWYDAIVGKRGSQKLNSFIGELQRLPSQLTEHIYSEIQEACRKLKSEPHHRRSYVGDVKVEFSHERPESFKSITVVEDKWGDSDENKITKVEADLEIKTAQISDEPYFTSNTEIREWISTVDPDVIDIEVLSEQEQTNAPWVLVPSKINCHSAVVAKIHE